MFGWPFYAQVLFARVKMLSLCIKNLGTYKALDNKSMINDTQICINDELYQGLALIFRYFFLKGEISIIII